MKELSEVLQDWEAVIGLEIHTELTALDTKMFCNCKLSHDDEPNANVCPVCLGLPGALPVPNKRAIESIVKAGLATNCEIQRHSMFYRKHYFYPDMAKNFQTTQGPVAFAMYGHLDLDVTGRGAAERPDCAFGEAEAQSLASASANAEGLSTSMTSTMREGNQRAGHLASYDASNLQMPERREDGSYTVPIRILRIHMEEDAAKMVHVGGAEGRITAAARPSWAPRPSSRTSTRLRACTTALPTRSAVRPRCSRRAASSIRRPATGSPAASAPWSCV